MVPFFPQGRFYTKNHFVIYMPLCGRFHLNSGIVGWYEKIVNTWTVLVYVITSQTLILKFTSRYIPVSYTHLDVYKRQVCDYGSYSPEAAL